MENDDVTTFIHPIDSIVCAFDTDKKGIKRYVTKHFSLDVDYTISMNESTGGRPSQRIMLTQHAFDLVMSTYNLQNRFVTKVNDVQFTSPLLLSVENSTIGFIVECIKNHIVCKRQFKVGNYSVDLYLPQLNLVVECDENGHQSYDDAKEKERESYIVCKLQCHVYRFNPQAKDFELHEVVKHIFSYVFAARESIISGKLDMINAASQTCDENAVDTPNTIISGKPDMMNTASQTYNENAVDTPNTIISRKPDMMNTSSQTYDENAVDTPNTIVSKEYKFFDENIYNMFLALYIRPQKDEIAYTVDILNRLDEWTVFVKVEPYNFIKGGSVNSYYSFRNT